MCGVGRGFFPSFYGYLRTKSTASPCKLTGRSRVEALGLPRRQLVNRLIQLVDWLALPLWDPSLGSNQSIDRGIQSTNRICVTLIGFILGRKWWFYLIKLSPNCRISRWEGKMIFWHRNITRKHQTSSSLHHSPLILPLPILDSPLFLLHALSLKWGEDWSLAHQKSCSSSTLNLG